ncbi:MAG: AAA family ATPase, partial [Deltaproteobacteria bacterium]|nr:AAA family ATPase [Deltaproteobacteria bacterium]
MMMDRDSLRIGRDRVARVFRYLEALNQHRNPAKRQIREQLWFLWFRDLPDHPSIRRGVIDQPSIVSAGFTKEPGPDSKKAGDDFVLKVQRPKLTQAPRPPEVIASWLEQGWEEPTGEVHIRASRNEVDNHGETRVVKFEDDPRRLQALETWKVNRDEWARNELPAREAMKIFEQFYELYGRIAREAERVELVLGDGILSWRRSDGGVYHPILLQRLQLDFNPTVPEFMLVETEHEVELYSALFRAMADVDGGAIASCRDELAEGDYHPLGDDGTSGFLRRLVVQLSPRGEFTDGGAPQGESEDPRIGRDPVIFLRARTLGFATAIEAVLEDLQHRKDLPGSLLNVVGIEPPVQQADDDKLSAEPWNDPEDILFSKPANPEQIRIAEQLERHGSVLVQGPPGTGKSHTIANLIGHLLAQGKSVLVTSHTTKALRVLRGHVVEKLRPLCVSVLESDIESRAQLEGSVEAIVRRLSTSNEQQLEAEANSLTIKRRELLAKLRKVRQDLIDARGDEYRDTVIAGQSYPPSEAARKVTQEKGKNDWIPAPVVLGATLPLSEGELIDLYRTNTIISPEDEVELAQVLPNPNDLPTPEDFDRMVKEKDRLFNLDLDFRSDLWDFPPTKDGLEELEALAERICRAAEQITVNHTWKLAAISAGRGGGASLEPWNNLLSMIDMVCKEAAASQEIRLRYGPALLDKIPLEEQGRIIEEILHHIHGSGKLSRLNLLIRPSWKHFIRESKVADGPACQSGHFRALLALVRLKISRRKLAGRWDRQMASLGAS